LAADGLLPTRLDDWLFIGGYPALHSEAVTPADWFASYMATYLERDVRDLTSVRDLITFQRCLRLCAARTGQLLNITSLATDCGIAQSTASAWLSILEASYIVFRLTPHFANFGKRPVKTPKLYFHDCGLAAFLLGIQTPAQLSTHAARGALYQGDSGQVLRDVSSPLQEGAINETSHSCRHDRSIRNDLRGQAD
jgi:predicted AAA+ superfamily ATPase